MNKNIKVQLVNGDQDNLFPSAYYDHRGSVIHDGLVTTEERTEWNDAAQQIGSHVSNSGIHVTSSSKTKWNNHVNDTTATLPVYHLTSNDRELLNSLYQKVYPIGCVYSSVENITPTFEGTTWESLSTTTAGSTTIYNWKRTE